MRCRSSPFQVLGLQVCHEFIGTPSVVVEGVYQASISRALNADRVDEETEEAPCHIGIEVALQSITHAQPVSLHSLNTIQRLSSWQGVMLG